MGPALSRIVFYGGTAVLTVVMCQDWFRRVIVSVLGEGTGESLYDFIRTNVEAPVSVIAIALYLDLVLRHRSAADARRAAGR